MVDAGACLAALQAAGLPVVGVRLLDPADSSTWSFDGVDVTPAAAAQARALLSALLTQPTIEEPPVLTAEAVLEWCAMKLGVDPIEATLEVVSGMLVKQP